VFLPANSGFDPEKYAFAIQKVVRDIGGAWNDVWSVPHGKEHTLGYDGTFQATDIPPGDYTLVRLGYSWWMGASMVGAANVWVKGTYTDSPRILFPVEAGKETHIAIHLSVLSAGLLREDGSAALGYEVHPICQSPWVCGHNDFFDPKTEADGLATLYVAPGTYDVMFEGYFGRCYRFSNISVGKNEVKTMVFEAGKADVSGDYHGECD